MTGHEGDYDLRFTPLGPPDPDSEREPNDDSVEAEVLRIGQQRTGRIATSGDHDVYRFSTVATERLVLHLEPPAGGSVAFTLAQAGRTLISAPSPQRAKPSRTTCSCHRATSSCAWSRARPAPSGTASGWSARIALTLAIDQEPNDTFADARPIPQDGVIEGTSDPSGGFDWYRLPPSIDGAPLEVAVEGPVTDLSVNDDITDYPVVQEDDGVYRSGGLPIDAPMALVVRASGPYRLTVSASTPAPPVERPELPATLTITLPGDAPAAYWPAGQHLAGTLTLTPEGDAPLDLTIDAVTSHPLVEVALDRSAVHLEPGAPVEVPLTVRFLPDLPRDRPIRLTVRARDAAGTQRTTFAEVVAGGDVPPLSPEQSWSLPDSMLGGLDIASLSLGAVTMPSLDPLGEDALHDGVAIAGTGLDAPFGALPLDLTVDLAGDDPAPVAGITLDPVAGGSTFQGVVRDFDLLLSTDGVTFQPALSGTLSPTSRNRRSRSRSPSRP